MAVCVLYLNKFGKTSPPQGRQDMSLERPALEHARHAEKRRHEHRVEDEGVDQKVRGGWEKTSSSRRDEKFQEAVEAVEGGARDQNAVDGHREQSADVLTDGWK